MSTPTDPTLSDPSLYIYYPSEAVTLGTDEIEQIDLEKGAIKITAFESISPESSMNEIAAANYRSVNKEPHVIQSGWPFTITIITDQTLQIDSYPARRIVRKSEEAEYGTTTIYWETSVFIATQDRWYELSIYTQEQDRNGQFARDFERLIESIHVIR
jgi:hypothetical protein